MDSSNILEGRERGAPEQNEEVQRKQGPQKTNGDVHQKQGLISREKVNVDAIKGSIDKTPNVDAPVLNLSDLSQRQHSSTRKLDLSHKKKFYSDSNLMNDTLVRREVESFKLKLKERQSEKAWAHLTTANLQSLTKSQEPTTKQHSFQRIRNWVQDAAPPYDTNPSPGVSSLRPAPPTGQTCLIFRLCSCFQP